MIVVGEKVEGGFMEGEREREREGIYCCTLRNFSEAYMKQREQLYSVLLSTTFQSAPEEALLESYSYDCEP